MLQWQRLLHEFCLLENWRFECWSGGGCYLSSVCWRVGCLNVAVMEIVE